MTITRRIKDAIKGFFILGFATLLTACGGGAAGGVSPNSAVVSSVSSASSNSVSSSSASLSSAMASSVSSSSAPTLFTLGGTVSGLAGKLILSNNGEQLAVTANGSFTFPTPLAANAGYLVTVVTQPVGLTCSITNGSGNATAKVTSVSVSCEIRTVATYFTLDIDKTKFPDGFYGFSMYTAMWPMVSQSYSSFQAGLVGTWINPDNLNFNQPLVGADHHLRESAPFMAPYYRGYQTIEGSGGYWNNTHFHSNQPKYRTNGTPNGYGDQLSAPGWGFGYDVVVPGTHGPWGNPNGTVGVAQLSNRLLVPPDGLTFKAGTNGEFFGAAWMALPLTSPTTGSNPVGDLSWTFFINSTNYQGPVLFYVPDVWEVLAATYPTASGRGLDARPAVFAGGLVMEMSIPFLLTTDASGTTYGRLAGMSFPVDSSGTTYLSSDLTVYTEAALFMPFKNWVKGGSAVSGQFSPTGTITPDISAQTIYMWSGLHGTADFKQMESNKGLANYVKPTVVTTAGGGSAWALKWQDGAVAGAYPEYFKSSGDFMVPIPAGEVPEGTGLTTASFPTHGAGQASYTSPSTWKTPAPAKGPYKATLVDGSVVTYYWYKFIDQPSMQGFGWTAEQKNALQTLVEKIHQNWGSNDNFIPPLTTGKLATMDTALLVTPPTGLEIGYVPVIVGQSN